MGRAVFSPCYLTWGQTMVEVVKRMVTSFKRSHACTATLAAPNPAAGHTDPWLCWRLLDTHRQVWVSLLWVHCSCLLGPGAHKVLFVPSKCLFSQSCVSSGHSMVRLMATSSKRAYVIPRSTAPRALYTNNNLAPVNYYREIWGRFWICSEEPCFSIANSDYIVFVMEYHAFNYLYSTIREAKLILL